MNVPEVQAAAVTDDAFLLDVREPVEWEAGHPPGAFHLPMAEIPLRAAAEIPTDRPVVVVCRVGGRSAQVVAFLMRQGFADVANLAGGLFAWAAAGRPLVTGDGSAGTVA